MRSLLDQLPRARKLLAVLRQPSYRRALLHGVAASVEHDRIPVRGDFRTVIDAGANRGQFALFALHRFPLASLLCFEPLPGPRSRLERVVDGSRCRVFDLALGSAAGTAEFHVSSADDSSSLLPIGTRQREEFPATGELTTVMVQVSRLDEALGPGDLTAPTLLKIDVQGGELDVLAGAGALLDSVDAVLVEASFVELYTGQALVDQVWSALREREFTCRGVWSVTYGRRGDCLQCDMLFARGDFDPFRAQGARGVPVSR